MRTALIISVAILLAGCGGPIPTQSSPTPTDSPSATITVQGTDLSPTPKVVTVTVTITPTPTMSPSPTPTPNPTSTPTPSPTSTPTPSPTPTASPTPSPTPTPTPRFEELVYVSDTTIAQNVSYEGDGDKWELDAEIRNENDYPAGVTAQAFVEYTTSEGDRSSIELQEKEVSINAESETEVVWTFVFDRQIREPDERVELLEIRNESS